MIKHNTVLILGAGASIPYGFPTTEGLRKEILELTKRIGVRNSNELGLGINLVLKFYESFFYSGTYSIDEFLGKRTEFIEIGKLFIAKVLLKYEVTGNLFSLESSKDWYKYLVLSLTENVSLEKLDVNKLTIVTFNYDRSLEQYLFLALKNQYGANDIEVAEQLIKLNIIHVHGLLGCLPWQFIQDPSKSVEYKNDTSAERVKKAAEGIKIIYETINNTPELEKAVTSIENAEKVLFLGFGYHPLNLKRLNLSGKKGGRLVEGTALGIGNVQIDKIVTYSNNTLHRHELLRDYDIIKLFQEKHSLT